MDGAAPLCDVGICTSSSNSRRYHKRNWKDESTTQGNKEYATATHAARFALAQGQATEPQFEQGQVEDTEKKNLTRQAPRARLNGLRTLPREPQGMLGLR